MVFGNILNFLGLNSAQKWTKTVNFGYVPFPLKEIIRKIVHRLSFSNNRLPLVKILGESSPYLGEKGPRNPPKRSHFMDAASPQKHLKVYNLTTSNVALVKLTTIMYLHNKFNLAEGWGVTHGVRGPK